MDNFDFQTFYNSSKEHNYFKNITSQSISENKKNFFCIPFQEQQQYYDNYYYTDQDSYCYSQPFDLYNQWMEDTTIENVKNSYIYENKDLYSYNIPPTTILNDQPNVNSIKENYKDHSYSSNKTIKPTFQQNTSLSSNELSLTSISPPQIENDTSLERISPHPGTLYLMPTLIRSSKKEKKNDVSKISKGRVSKKPSMHINSSCITCGTTETTLWRRDINGFPECNPCNLYYRTHQIKRPPRLFKNGKILKRNGKNKQLKGTFGCSPLNDNYDKDFINFDNNIIPKNKRIESNFEEYSSNRIMIDEKSNSMLGYFNDNHKNATSQNYFFPSYIDNYY